MRLVLAAAVAAAWLGGCAPLSVTFTLGKRPHALREVAVAEPQARPKIAQVDISGVLVDGPSRGVFGAGPSPVDELVVRLRRAETDPEVRAVLLRINSPGGTVSASDLMHAEIRAFAERSGKPVVASLGEVAASGGYYVALAADEIIAQPTSVTGSVGVIIQTFSVHEGLARLGIRARAVTSGPSKDMANPFSPPSDAHDALLQDLVDEFHARFRTLVLERRPESRADDFEPLLDGRVVSGAKAVRAGLADREGDLRAAFARAKELAGVSEARLVRYYSAGAPPRSPYAAVAGEAPPPGAGTDVSLVRVDLGLPRLEYGPSAWYLWTP